MKPSEFYLKYWRIKNADGTETKPPDLTQQEKDFIDNNIDNSMSKLINLQPKDYRNKVKAWILKYDLVVVFIIIAFCWLLLASKWCRQQYREGVQTNTAKSE